MFLSFFLCTTYVYSSPIFWTGLVYNLDEYNYDYTFYAFIPYGKREKKIMKITEMCRASTIICEKKYFECFDLIFREKKVSLGIRPSTKCSCWIGCDQQKKILLSSLSFIFFSRGYSYFSKSFRVLSGTVFPPYWWRVL